MYRYVMKVGNLRSFSWQQSVTLAHYFHINY